MNYECIVEIFEGVNVKIKYTRVDEVINILKTSISNNKGLYIEIDLPKEASEALKDYILDEIDSIPFNDSTVKFEVNFPN